MGASIISKIHSVITFLHKEKSFEKINGSIISKSNHADPTCLTEITSFFIATQGNYNMTIEKERIRYPKQHRMAGVYSKRINEITSFHAITEGDSIFFFSITETYSTKEKNTHHSC